MRTVLRYWEHYKQYSLAPDIEARVELVVSTFLAILLFIFGVVQIYFVFKKLKQNNYVGFEVRQAASGIACVMGAVAWLIHLYQ